MNRHSRLKYMLIGVFLSLFLGTSTCFGYSVFYDFNSGLPTEFSGAGSIQSVQGFNGIGTGTNTFSGGFLRNYTTGNPAQPTVLTLTGLPDHTSIDLNFLLAVIDSWDGTATSVAPDYFNVTVDGASIFTETFDNFNLSDQSYSSVSPLSFGSNLGYTPGWSDSAYNMGLDSVFDGIAHTSDNLTIAWFASGSGWQGRGDESWAIDNVEIVLNGVQVPEPATMLLLGVGLLGLAGISRRKIRK